MSERTRLYFIDCCGNRSGRSGTPSAVFGTLIKLSKHHLAKLKQGGRVFFEKTLQEIIGGINGEIAFPPHLTLEDQGRFAVGYYHQMQDSFAKKTV